MHKKIEPLNYSKENALKYFSKAPILLIRKIYLNFVNIFSFIENITFTLNILLFNVILKISDVREELNNNRKKNNLNLCQLTIERSGRRNFDSSFSKL